MNNTRQLASRIVERLDEIPNGFRNLDKDQLLNDIRDLYDQALELETVQYVQPQATAPEPKKAVVATPVVETPEPAVKTVPEGVSEKPEPPKAKPEPAAVETPVVEAEAPSDEGTLAGKLNQKPIADLRSGIPLNEKFGFIRNLFANNASDYADAILKLNDMDALERATEYVEKLAKRNSWDNEETIVKTFKAYVERRHLAVSEANADQ